jgi:hypothetical protein
VIQNQNPEQFNLLASALFSAPATAAPVSGGGGGVGEEDDPFASTTHGTKTDEGEVLRLPNRAVTVTKTKKEKSNVTFNETQQPEVLRGPITGAGAGATGSGDLKSSHEEEEEEEEDEETLLPRMTEAEKVAWRAKQEDLTRRRKG